MQAGRELSVDGLNGALCIIYEQSSIWTLGRLKQVILFCNKAIFDAMTSAAR